LKSKEIFQHFSVGVIKLLLSQKGIGSLVVRGQTGNGANFRPDGSANKACVAGARTG
jgi:hypothetical protein